MVPRDTNKSLQPDYDSPNEVAAFHVFINGRSLLELENTVNQWANSMQDTRIFSPIRPLTPADTRPVGAD